VSVRIPTATRAANGAGYIEDRRPASNMDPYIVTAMILDTTSELNKSGPIIKQYKEWADWF